MARLSGVVAEYLAREFGGRFEAFTENFTVNNADTILLESDPERVLTLVVNRSNNSANLRIGKALGSGDGIELPPDGGTWSANLRDDFVLPSYEIIAPASGGPRYYSVTWVRRYAKETIGGNDNAA